MRSISGACTLVWLIPKLVFHLYPVWAVVAEKEVVVFLVFIFDDAFVFSFLGKCIWLIFFILHNILDVVVVFLEHRFRKLFLDFIILTFIDFFLVFLSREFEFPINKASNLI